MEKLINLYYEYKLDLLKREMRVNWATEREIEMTDIEKVEEEELQENLNKLSELKPFVKRLVENSKEDWRQVDWIVKYVWENYDGSDTEYYNLDEEMLMFLAISDNPIELLISMLK